MRYNAASGGWCGRLAGVPDGAQVRAPRPGGAQRARRRRQGRQAVRLRADATRRRRRPVLQADQRPAAAQVDGARVDTRPSVHRAKRRLVVRSPALGNRHARYRPTLHSLSAESFIRISVKFWEKHRYIHATV